MSRKYSIVSALAVLLCASGAVIAQTGELRGSVQLIGADGKPAPVAGAQVDVFRTDITGDYHTKTDKKGSWVFAGLPYVGMYLVAVSAPGAQPNATGGVTVRQDTPVSVILQPGDGKRLTREEAAQVAKSGGPSLNGGKESAADKAKVEELRRKNEEIVTANKKIEEANKIVGDTFKAGNQAFNSALEADRANKREEAVNFYGEAVKQYEAGLAADPDQAALWTQKANALKARGVDNYNIWAQTPEGNATKAAKLDAAKADFRAAAEAANKAVDRAKAEPSSTDAGEQTRQTGRKYSALSVRAEAMRLFVTKVDQTQTDAGIAAFQEYIAAETDAKKKARAEADLAQMLFDANAFDKAQTEYQKILAENPGDPDALVNMGMILFNLGALKEGEGNQAEAKAKYQEAANYLQQFVDKAPDTHRLKADARAVLEALKDQQKVQAEKTTTTTPRRRRP
jgi:tetratricopeptide (TPR) repeat protein